MPNHGFATEAYQLPLLLENKTMNLNSYQINALATAIYEQPSYPFLALSEEVGEVQGKVAKAVRKTGIAFDELLEDVHTVTVEGPDGVKNVDKKELLANLQGDLVKELGDVLWQLANCAAVLGLDLETIARANLDKLADRQERNVLEGSGDNR